jgi:histone H3/H4
MPFKWAYRYGLLNREDSMGEILIVTSKIKKLISEKTEFNTSGEFIDALSHRVENLCLEAAARARVDKRKTVKARDLI